MYLIETVLSHHSKTQKFHFPYFKLSHIKYLTIIMIYFFLQFFVIVPALSSSIEKPVQQSYRHILESLQERINKLQNDNAFMREVYPIYNNDQECQQNLTRRNNLGEYNISRMSYEQLPMSKQMKNYCQIAMLGEGSHFLFQTPKGAYIGVNNALDDAFGIYNLDCQLIAKIQHITVQQMCCDRGLCDDGNVIILTQNLTIMVCSQNNNFSHCSTIVSLMHALRGQLVGLVVRNKGSAKLQVYVADSAGEIIVYDGEGNRRLSVLVEKDSFISNFIDVHPNPIVISSRGWIYTFDNVKKNILLTRCPFLFHNITHVFISHPYSTILYLIGPSVVIKLNIKSPHKDCQISGKFYGGNEMEAITALNKKKIPIAELQGRVYIGNKIISMKEKTINEFSECGNDASFNFQLMKNNYRKGCFTIQCCRMEKQSTKCSVIVFRNRNNEPGNSMNNTVIMIVILLLIVLLIFFFLRNSEPNSLYDEQLKYNHNLRYKTEVEQLLRQSNLRSNKNVDESSEQQMENMVKTDSEEEKKDK